MGYKIDLINAPRAREFLQDCVDRTPRGGTTQSAFIPLTGRPDKSGRITTFSEPSGFINKQEATREIGLILRALEKIKKSKKTLIGSSAGQGIAPIITRAGWDKSAFPTIMEQLKSAAIASGITEKELEESRVGQRTPLAPPPW